MEVMTPVSVELIEIDAADSHPDLLRQACELLCEVWPKPGRTPESRLSTFADEFAAFQPDALRRPRSWVAVERGRVIGHSAILPREIDLAGTCAAVAGLARVCTAPDCRGRGLGELLVRAAWQPVDSGEFDCSLFQTSPPVRSFYERLGAVVVENRIINSLGEDSQACPFWDEVIMRYPSQGEWPGGTIDLLGPGY